MLHLLAINKSLRIVVQYIVISNNFELFKKKKIHEITYLNDFWLPLITLEGKLNKAFPFAGYTYVEWHKNKKKYTFFNKI